MAARLLSDNSLATARAAGRSVSASPTTTQGAPVPVVTKTVQLYDGFTMFSATSAAIDVDRQEDLPALKDRRRRQPRREHLQRPGEPGRGSRPGDAAAAPRRRSAQDGRLLDRFDAGAGSRRARGRNRGRRHGLEVGRQPGRRGAAGQRRRCTTGVTGSASGSPGSSRLVSSS